MKKIIPFEKEIKFNTKIYEINSISLEHTLKYENSEINGDFIISGDYKESDALIKTEPFIYNIPFNILLDERYEEVSIDIEDFKYEVINEEKLNIKINVLVNVDVIEEKPNIIVDEEIKENDKRNDNELIEKLDEEKIIEEEIINNVNEEDKRNVFDNYFVEDESYITYHVHIFRENDSIENIIKLYNLKEEDLKEYNDLSKITVGSKIIIPSYEL